MKKVTVFSLLLLGGGGILSCHAQDRLSIVPGAVWPDNHGVHINAHGGGVMDYKGIYYWYGEHKIEGRIGNTAQAGVHCYSSVDLLHWKDEGIVLKVEDDPQSPITRGCVLERPKVIYNQKYNNFVMWFHLELKGQGYNASLSGVAVSDAPAGPFTFVGSFRPEAGVWPQNVLPAHLLPVADTIRSAYCGGLGCLPAHPDTLNLLGRDFEGGQMARDQNLFVDDDGTAYHIYSSEENSTLHIARLTDDYLSGNGEYVRVFSNRYMEAPAIFKKGDFYYLIASDCTGWDPNAARLARAPAMFGPWTELGNPCHGPDAEVTFHSQSTFVLPVRGREGAFIFMADRWTPENPIDGSYIWLPVQFDHDGTPFLEWMDSWDLSFFTKSRLTYTEQSMDK